MKDRIVIGQSGGCTAVINATLVGAVEQARRQSPKARILGAVHGVEGVLSGQYVNLTDVPADRLGSLSRTPAACLGSCRYKLRPGDAERVAAELVKREVTAFLYIGGNDSADTALSVYTAARRQRKPFAVIGVPKTIDNDLVVTDHTPGYGSAARYLACVVPNAGRDSEAMRLDEPVKIIEVSGRNSGWLTCAGTIGKRDGRDAPQFVWPPEIPFSSRRFLSLVKDWVKRIGFCVVVVGETVRDRSGRPISSDKRGASVDAFGHPRIVGAAEFLCDLVRDRLGLRSRWEKMGTIGRTSASHVSPVDRLEARRVGAASVRYALRGESGQEVVLLRKTAEKYRCRVALAPLEEVANAEKRLAPDMFDPDSMLPTPAFVCYAQPLIGRRLPHYVRLPGITERSLRVRGKSGT